MVPDYEEDFRQDEMPKGWNSRAKDYPVTDTSFRDYYLRVISRPSPERSLVY